MTKTGKLPCPAKALIPAIAVILVLGLIVAACGGDDGGVPEAGDDQGAAEAVAEGEAAEAPSGALSEEEFAAALTDVCTRYEQEAAELVAELTAELGLDEEPFSREIENPSEEELAELDAAQEAWGTLWERQIRETEPVLERMLEELEGLSPPDSLEAYYGSWIDLNRRGRDLYRLLVAEEDRFDEQVGERAEELERRVEAFGREHGELIESLGLPEDCGFELEP